MTYKNLPQEHKSYFDFTTLSVGEKAWLAGLLDGEGCLRFDTCSGKGLPAISLWMTCEKTVTRYAKTFELTVKKRNRNSMKEHHKDCYGAHMSTHKAAKLSEALLPWLYTKSDIGKELSEFYIHTCKTCSCKFWAFNDSYTCSKECYRVYKLEYDRLYRLSH
jgi:hypothetical protein